jgi:hypothetical protein
MPMEQAYGVRLLVGHCELPTLHTPFYLAAQK